jgi:PAS domain S-box-containing protein
METNTNSRNSLLREVSIVAGCAIAYFLAHQIAFFFPDSEKVIMSVWPAGGVGLASLLLSPYRRRPALVVAFYIAGIAADVVIANRPFLAGVGYMTGNMAESIGCALVIIRMNGTVIRFNRINEVFALILGVVFVNAVSSCIGAITGVISRGASFGHAWTSWYVADGLGVLILTPVFVTWSSVNLRKLIAKPLLLVESVVFLVIWCTAAWYSFQAINTEIPFAPHPYMLIALLAWPAFRYGQHMVSSALLLLAIVGIADLLLIPNASPLGGEDLSDRLLSFQIFLGFTASTGFLLAATFRETKAAEKASRIDQERLRTLGDNIPNGMVYQMRKNKNGSRQFIYVSQGVERVNGIPVDKALRDPSALYDLIVEEDRASLAAQEEESERSMSDFNLVVRFRRPDGEIRCMHLSSSPRRQSDSAVIWDGIQMDITEQKRLEAERERMEQQLFKAQKLESLGVLAGGIAHDFNNLLGGIFGFIDLALEESRNDKVTEYLSKAMTSIGRARGLTAQMLTFSLGGTPVRQVGNLLPVVQEAVHFALSGSNVSPRFFISETLRPCSFDKNQIAQVVDNIVINAKQAMQNGGVVEVTLADTMLQDKEHATLPAGDYVKISIKDFGIGIDNEFLPRIFDPFFSTKVKGHGLGLATCYSIINRHDGFINVESQPGKGSTFHIYLPAVKESAVRVSEYGFATAHSGQGVFVVVDDEEAMRETVGVMLRSFGYTPMLFGDGRDAVHFFQTEIGANRAPAGMLLDLTIPGGMGGKDAVLEIRKLSSTIPVFVMSGYADDPVMAEPAGYGFSAGICKPFKKSNLRDLLNRCMMT